MAGMVSCLTILLYVFDQAGYNQHHENTKSICQTTSYFDGFQSNIDDVVLASSSAAITFAMKENFQEVEKSTRVILTDLFIPRTF